MNEEQFDSCEEILPGLLDQVARGKNAQERLSESAAHLKQCRRCSDAAKLMQAHVGILREWEQLAKDVQEPEEEVAVWLSGARWLLGGLGGRGVRLLSRAHVGTNTVGRWQFSQLSSVRALGPVAPPLGFTTAIADGAAEITLTVSPQHLAEEGRESWRVRFDMQESSCLTSVDVGILGVDSYATGMQELRISRPVEFQVPPGGQPYCIWFQWLEDGAVRSEHRELPTRLTARQEPDKGADDS